MLIAVFVVAWLLECGFLTSRFDLRRLLFGVLPALGIGAGYFVLRFLVMKTWQIGGGPNYTPNFAPKSLFEHGWMTWGNVWNVSVGLPDPTLYGFADVRLALLFTYSILGSPAPITVLLAVTLALFVASVVWMIRVDRRVLVPLALCACF